MYKYYVVEIQTNSNGTSGFLQYGYTADQKNDAYAKYGELYAVAAMSSVLVHTVVLITREGESLEHKCFTHPVVAQEIGE